MQSSYRRIFDIPLNVKSNSRELICKYQPSPYDAILVVGYQFFVLAPFRAIHIPTFGGNIDDSGPEFVQELDL